MPDGMNRTAKRMLVELAWAWRCDWNSFDGRTLRRQLKYILEIEDGSGETVEAARERLDLCPHGGGHWTENCDGTCEDRGGVRHYL